MLEKWFERFNRRWGLSAGPSSKITFADSTNSPGKSDSLGYMGSAKDTYEFDQPDDDVVWYPMRTQSVENIGRLINRIENEDDPPYRTTLSEIEGWKSNALPCAGVVAVARHGKHKGDPVCYARVVMRSRNECVGTGGIDPDFRSSKLSEALVSWQVSAGRTLLDEHGADGTKEILVNVDAAQTQFQNQLRARGFVWRSSTHEVRRTLENLPAIPDVGSYVDIVPWATELEEPARRFYNKLASGTGNYPRVPAKQWGSAVTEFNLPCSFAALDRSGDRPQIIGLIMVGTYPSDWDVLGWREGYIDFLGVDQVSDAQNITRALIITSLEAQKEMGLQKSAASGGIRGADRASLIYEELGFEPSFEVHTYALEL